MARFRFGENLIYASLDDPRIDVRISMKCLLIKWLFGAENLL